MISVHKTLVSALNSWGEDLGLTMAMTSSAERMVSAVRRNYVLLVPMLKRSSLKDAELILQRQQFQHSNMGFIQELVADLQELQAFICILGGYRINRLDQEGGGFDTTYGK
ncbi:hypothetical protein VNO77_27564 [Canavalia gladiata]|uniref:Uncharacterized protein n=1 Tax=Canavalia gladiata TaxID=3824 RepID=A0AAN9Q492_CANGL